MIQPCVIIDDEKLARQKIALYIDQIDGLQLKGSYATAEAFLADWQQADNLLLFLDIQLPFLSGLELATMIRQGNQVIFTTAYAEHALKGFELAAVDYLLKPFAFQRFQQAVNKVQKITSLQDYILIKAGKKKHRLRYSEIRYIEGLKEYVIWHTDKGKIVAYTSLKKVVQQLAPYNFNQVHKSFIVNFARVDYFETSSIHIGKIDIPVGRAFKTVIAKYIGG